MPGKYDGGVMKKKLITGILVVFTLSLFAADPHPFREMIDNAGDADKYPNASTIVIFDSMDVKVMESGLSYVTHHTLTKVLKATGSKELQSLTFGYDPQSAYVEIKGARIFRHGGGVDTLSLQSVFDHTAPARAIYWGAREKMLPVGHLQPGDAVEVITFRKGFTYALLQQSDESLSEQPGDERFIPPMRGHFYDIVPFWSRTPVLLKSYTVSLPLDKNLQYQVYNGELQSWSKLDQERMRYHFEKKDILPLQREAHMVATSDVATKLLLSTSPDWEAKSLWFYNVNENVSFNLTPEIIEKVKALTEECKSDEEKVSVLTHWVADEIRYSGLTMGEGEGYTLHPAEMTFRDRCGVCKDKAGMLVAMLRAAGLESYAAMTMAGSRIDRIPADQFNHSVTIWKRGEGDYVLLDPTWVPHTRELWSSREQQQEYLMGVPEGADLKTTPISPPQNHPLVVTGKSELQSDGTLTGSFTLTADGQADSQIRRNLTRRRKQDWHHYFDRELFDLSSRIQVKSLRYNDPYDISQPMKITVDYEIPAYAQTIGDKLVFIPLLAKHVFAGRYTSPYLHMRVGQEERTYPFRIGCSQLIEFEESIRLPKGYETERLPEFETVEGSAADFEAGYEKKRNRVQFSEKIALKKRIFQAGEWKNFRHAIREANSVREEFVILIKK